MQGTLQVGMRVEVGIGKNKVYAGIVYRIHDSRPEHYRVKPIRAVIDPSPSVSILQLAFWYWIASYYMANIGEVMAAALPAHLKLMSESLLIWNDALDQPPLGLSDDAFLIAEALFLKKQLTIGEASKVLAGKNSTKGIHELLDKEIALISEILEERYKPLKEKRILLAPALQDDALLEQAFETLYKAPKQLELLMAFLQLRQQQTIVPAASLTKAARCGQAQINALIEKGILVMEEAEVDRLSDEGAQSLKELSLSASQETALAHITDLWSDRTAVLLHGVTGSGKTLIYIKLIQEALKHDKQVLLLLPEIALTSQIVSRLRQYFGSELGVYHSRFSNNERVEVWKKVQSKKYRIVIGPRSAIWLPFEGLSHIIIDEEHDSSYKQSDSAPRFHARDAALYLAHLHGAKVLLGTATPSLESYAHAQSGKYGYVRLSGRFNEVALPKVDIVPARNVVSSLSPILTTDLLHAISENIDQGKQVILFQNKRGYAPFLMCNSCGHVAHCKQCDVSLTYHKATDKLHCHYCGSRSERIVRCPECGHDGISAKSYGTERIEEELQKIFPKCRTGRLDWDSTKGKNKMAQLLQQFAKGDIQILVGTQMVVKGLDFDNVGLVGIISADSLLSYPDFRVNERAYQLMEQVSGRAGRSDGAGKVIIQAYKQKHDVLKWVQEHDHLSFFEHEMAYRKEFAYPPFVRMIKILVKHRNEQKAREAIDLLTSFLLAQDLYIKGPSPSIVPRVRNNYLFEVYVKLPRDLQRLNAGKEGVRKSINQMFAQKGFQTIQVAIDVDPQ